jgi:hypothetical protein
MVGRRWNDEIAFTMAEGLSEWTGLNFALNGVTLNSDDDSVTVDWSKDSTLIAGLGDGPQKDEFRMADAVSLNWFMMDSMAMTLKKNLDYVTAVYYRSDGKPITFTNPEDMAAQGLPELPIDQSYEGSAFFVSHAGNGGDDIGGEGRGDLIEETVPNGGFPPFAPDGFVVEDGLLYSVNAEGEKKQAEGAEVVEAETEGGKIYWLAADPEAGGSNEGLYKDWAGGIYFFGSDGNFINCLEREDAQKSYVQFSPDGKRFILDSGEFVTRQLLLYEFDGLELKKEFYGMPSPEWLDDSYRFAFTLIDTSKISRYENADIFGWMSVAVYDSAVDLLTTVAEATATEDFMLSGVDRESGELNVTKLSVSNEKDWADESKHATEDIKVPLPAAG